VTISVVIYSAVYNLLPQNLKYHVFIIFSLRARKDLRDLFDQLAITCRSMSDSSLNDGSLKSSPEHAAKPPQRIGKIKNVIFIPLTVVMLFRYNYVCLILL
jgi:hypothetical protein